MEEGLSGRPLAEENGRSWWGTQALWARRLDRGSRSRRVWPWVFRAWLWQGIACASQCWSPGVSGVPHGVLRSEARPFPTSFALCAHAQGRMVCGRQGG